MPGLVLALSRHRAALSFGAALPPVPGSGHRVAAADVSGVRPHAPTRRKLSENDPSSASLPDRRSAKETPPGHAQKDQHGGCGNRTGNANTDHRNNGSATTGKEDNPAKARRIARIARFYSAIDIYEDSHDDRSARDRRSLMAAPMPWDGTGATAIDFPDIRASASSRRNIENSREAASSRSPDRDRLSLP